MEKTSIEKKFHTLLNYSISDVTISSDEYIELLDTYEKLGPECAMEDLMQLLREEEYRRSSDERATTISIIGLISAVVLIMLIFTTRR